MLCCIILLLVTACYRETALPDGLEDDPAIIPIDDTYQETAPIDAFLAEGGDAQRSITNAPYDYIIGTGDVMRIKLSVLDPSGGNALLRVIPQPASTTSEALFVVDGAGYVTVPLAGRVKVGNMPFTEAQAAITQALGRYFRNPQLDIAITQFAHGRVVVTGDVTKPSEIILTDKRLTVMDALSQSDGVNPTADIARASITNKEGMVEPIDLMALLYRGASRYNKTLQQGDTLHVPRGNGNMLYLFGEVKETGMLAMHRWNMTLSETLSESGGLDLTTADPNHIYVIRGEVAADGTRSADLRIFHLNSSDPRAFAHADRFIMQPRDVVWIGTQPITEWNRFIMQLLPAGTAGLVQPAPYVLK